jgi:Flp pilus assembly protein TadD
MRGQLKDAEALHRRALEARERTLGAEHPSTLASVYTLAICLQTRGQLKDAEALYRRAFDSQERTLRAEHPSTLPLANNLAICLKARGQLKDAKSAKGHLCSCLNMFRRLLPSIETE